MARRSSFCTAPIASLSGDAPSVGWGLCAQFPCSIPIWQVIADLTDPLLAPFEAAAVFRVLLDQFRARDLGSVGKVTRCDPARKAAPSGARRFNTPLLNRPALPPPARRPGALGGLRLDKG